MLDLRPVGYVIGLLVAVLGASMALPMVADLIAGNGHWPVFLESGIVTALAGGLIALSCANGLRSGLSVQASFLLTAATWTVLPVFAALPFGLGSPNAGLLDAYFESVSGITTTGASILVDIDAMPAGILLWRAMLNWFGGLGIAFIAMIFLPIMRVGGMQFFRTEGFDTFGKILPRATDIARQLFFVYAALTVLCVASYMIAGMPGFEAALHGLATIATGGFSPRAASFQGYSAGIEYTAALFMILGSLPYVRYLQMMRGRARPLMADRQVRGYLVGIAAVVTSVSLWRMATSDQATEAVFREALFNLVSVMSCTGFSTGSFGGWGSLPMVVALWVGIVGACSGSSSAGLSVFRVQVILAVLRAEIVRMHSRHRVISARYDGRAIDAETKGAVVRFAGACIITPGGMAVLIEPTGVDFQSALFASWTSMANIGYGYGPMLAPTGTFDDFPVAAKVPMIVTMILGRLSLLTVFVILLPRFWRA